MSVTVLQMIKCRMSTKTGYFLPLLRLFKKVWQMYDIYMADLLNIYVKVLLISD